MAFALDVAPAFPRSGIIVSAEQHGRVYLDASALSTIAKFEALSNVQPSKLKNADELIRQTTPASLNTGGVWLLSNPTFLVVQSDSWLTQDPTAPPLPAYLVTSSATPFTARLKSVVSSATLPSPHTAAQLDLTESSRPCSLGGHPAIPALFLSRPQNSIALPARRSFITNWYFKVYSCQSI